MVGHGFDVDVVVVVVVFRLSSSFFSSCIDWLVLVLVQERQVLIVKKVNFFLEDRYILLFGLASAFWVITITTTTTTRVNVVQERGDCTC